VWNLVSHFTGRTYAEGFREEGTEKCIWVLNGVTGHRRKFDEKLLGLQD
jgi:hypothetical protein